MEQFSGKAGSAYQFIEIPDLNKNRFSLSSLFVVNREEDAPWISSEANDEARNLLYPDVFHDDMRAATRQFYSTFYHRQLTDAELDKILATATRKTQ